jgi:hypothetical protein
MAIAHDLEELCTVQAPAKKAPAKRGRKAK